MLTITPTAATVLEQARTSKGAPDDYGVRFFATEEAGSKQARLAFKFVKSPFDDDTILDDRGIDAYVAPEVDRLIGDVTVDAEQTDAGMNLVVRRTAAQG